MRKHFALIGVGVIALVGILAVGATSGNGTSSSGEQTAAASLPSGQPSTTGSTVPVETTPRATPAAADHSARQTVAKLERACRRHPKSCKLLLKLGDAYVAQQRYVEAETAFQEAVRLEPADPYATVRLAMVWHAVDDTERAIEAVEAVLTSAPDNQYAHYSLAIMYFSQGRTQDARKEWAAAEAIDSSSTIGHRSRSFVELIDGKSTAEGRDE